MLTPQPETKSGRLIMAANSLGNPLDIPQRSLEALRTADLIIFEEDKVARQTLKAAGIHRDYLRLTEHAEPETLDAVRKALKEAKTVVFMSDQGTPTLADPGQKLLEIAYIVGAAVTPIPGPCAVTTALSICPFLTGPFLYLGFPPRETEERDNWLNDQANSTYPLVLLDTPYRRQATLDACLTSFGADRRALLVIDIGGPNEAVHLNKLENIAKLQMAKENFVLVIAPSSKAKRAADDKRENSADKADKFVKPQLPPQQPGPRVIPPKGRTKTRNKKPTR